MLTAQRALPAAPHALAHADTADHGDRVVRVEGRALRSLPEAARLLRGEGAPGGVVRLRLAPSPGHDPSPTHAEDSDEDDDEDERPQTPPQAERSALMGSNVSRHAGKRANGAGAAGGPAPLAGRRALSSGSLCNGHNHKSTGAASARAATPGDGAESDVGGGGDASPAERAKLCASLPNHLDGGGAEAGLGAGNGSGGEGGLELRLQPLQPLRPAPTLPVPPSPYSLSLAPTPSPEPIYEPAPPPPPPGAPLPVLTAVCVTDLYPFITPEATFAVSLARGPRGLGLSLAGGAEDARDAWPGLVRVKRLFPQQPAWACGRLRQGDILLAANGVPLLGLTSYEALEVLRRATPDVLLTVCRPPAELCCLAPPCEPPPPPPPPRRLPPSAPVSAASVPHYATLPPPRARSPPAPLGHSFQSVCAGEEVVVTLRKVNRSLGFTLRRGAPSVAPGDASDSDGGAGDAAAPGGHFVRALVREPALSDGRIRPGDQILEVNGLDVSGLTHEEAVAFLRRCGDEVTLRLRRPAPAPPPPLAPAPAPPSVPDGDPPPPSPSDDERPLRPKVLRREAMDMLSELAGRRASSPGDSSSAGGGGGGSSGRPRRHVSPASTPTPGTAASSPQRRARPLHPMHPPYPCVQSPPLPPPPPDSPPPDSSPSPEDSPNDPATPIPGARPSPSPAPAHDGLAGLAPATELRPARPSSLALAEGAWETRAPADGCDGAPASLPPLPIASADPADAPEGGAAADAFACRQQPLYQSAQPALRAGAGAAPGAAGAASAGGLLKWKGVVFTPEAEEAPPPPGLGSEPPPPPAPPEPLEGTRLTVELSRGWNARLGFSLRALGRRTTVSAVHADSVAARDGRLRPGDFLVEVNEESVEHMTTPDIIDLLRKIRGTIAITVVRPSAPPQPPSPPPPPLPTSIEETQ